MTTASIDQSKAEAFAGQMMSVLNNANTALCLSVGHRAGLFDVMADLPPSTSQEIADRSGLNERYVREWLNALTVSRVVDYDRAARTYRLPPEHAAALTRAAGPGNLAQMAQFLPLLAGVEDGILDAFRNGGGVPYSGFPKFTSLMGEMSASIFDLALVDVTIPLVPGIVPRLEAGIDVADTGCGAGHAINLMARKWPNSRFTGIDFSEEALAAGRREAAEWGLSNATFMQADLAALTGSDEYDLITTFDAVHDQADPAAMLANVARLLRPGGTYLCADIQARSDVADNLDHPIGALAYTSSLFHCMTVSLAQGGAGLGSMWGEEKAKEMLTEAGFTHIDVKQVEGDIINNYYICRKA